MMSKFFACTKSIIISNNNSKLGIIEHCFFRGARIEYETKTVTYNYIDGSHNNFTMQFRDRIIRGIKTGESEIFVSKYNGDEKETFVIIDVMSFRIPLRSINELREFIKGVAFDKYFDMKFPTVLYFTDSPKVINADVIVKIYYGENYV